MKINNAWKLEGFVAQKEAKASIKLGFIGVGQGGSKIADAFAGLKTPVDQEQAYPVMIINSNLGDIRSLKNVPFANQKGLKGYEKGVGKKPEVGRQAFEENGADIFDDIMRVMKDCEKIYVCGSLGGGTGTGIINLLVDTIADYMGIPVASIVSLPVPDEIESLNAFNALSELTAKLNEYREDDQGGTYRVLENLIILDNQKIIKEHLEDPEVKNLTWDYYSNYKVASILHEWNVVCSLESDITLDAADLMNHVFMTGGVLTFAKKKINLDKDIRSKEDLIEEIVSTYKGKNVLANGFDYQKDTKSMAICVVLPKDRSNEINQDTLEIIKRRIKEDLPDISIYTGFANWGSEKNAIVYTIASLAGLPERARALRQEAIDLKNKRMERENQTTGLGLGEKIESNSSNSGLTRRARKGNPYQNQNENQPTEGKKRNPFRKN
jgi:hypothetical protein